MEWQIEISLFRYFFALWPKREDVTDQAKEVNKRYLIIYIAFAQI